MDYETALQALRDAYRSGDMTADEYEAERMALDYAHGEACSAMDDERVTA